MKPGDLAKAVWATGGEFTFVAGRLAIRGPLPDNLRDVVRANAPAVRDWLESSGQGPEALVARLGQQLDWSNQVRIVAIRSSPPGFDAWRMSEGLPQAAAVEVANSTHSQLVVVSDLRQALIGGVIDVCSVCW